MADVEMGTCASCGAAPAVAIDSSGRCYLCRLDEDGPRAPADRAEALVNAILDNDEPRTSDVARVRDFEAMVRDEEREAVRLAHHEVCTCGGAGPGEGCPACELWHVLVRPRAGEGADRG